MSDLSDIKTYLEYNAETGIFKWIKKWNIKANKIKIGVPLTGYDKDGYCRIHFKGTTYKAHRLAWWFNYGCFPDKSLDHINGDRKDNRICNLREVTPRENSRNQIFHREGKLYGTSFKIHKFKTSWYARSTLSGKETYLGVFDTEKEAHQKVVEYENNLTELYVQQ